MGRQFDNSRLFSTWPITKYASSFSDFLVRQLTRKVAFRRQVIKRRIYNVIPASRRVEIYPPRHTVAKQAQRTALTTCFPRPTRNRYVHSRKYNDVGQYQVVKKAKVTTGVHGKRRCRGRTTRGGPERFYPSNRHAGKKKEEENFSPNRKRTENGAYNTRQFIIQPGDNGT